MRWIWGILLALAATATAQQPEAKPPIIHKIEIADLTRVSESLIRSQLESKVGEPLSPPAVGRDIRRISEMGYFTNVEVHIESRDGQNILIYKFFEEQSIGELVIAGNKKLKDRDIRSALNQQEGDAFFPEAFESEREALLTLYKDKGFLNATVDITAEQIGDSDMRVSYLISEGRKARIKKVAFRGNDALSTRKLRRIVKTGNGFLLLSGKYKEEKFENDLQSILTRYGDIGRLEATIPNTDFDYSRGGKRLIITIDLNEGPEYTMGSLDIDKNFVFTDAELLDLIEIKPGDIHNKSQVEADALAIAEQYSDSGYINARTNNFVALNDDDHTTNVIHQVTEGSLMYIGAVTVTGNSVTKDEVVRRNILLAPGDRFDGSGLDDSLIRLNRTQFFKELRPSLGNVPGDDRFVDLLIDVEEGKTGLFNFGAGLNTDTGIGGFGEIRLNNFDITNPPTFSGGGQSFSASANIGDFNTSYQLGFTDPEFLGYPLSAGVDLFDTRFESRGGSDFITEQTGARVRLGKRLSDHITLRTFLNYADVTISNLETFVDPSLRVLEDPQDTLKWGWSVIRDTANHFLDPTKGTRFQLTNEWAGFGSENEFFKIMTDSTIYYGIPKFEKWAVSLNNRTGYAKPFGDTDLVPLSERFFAGGGTTVRGYDNRDIGPKASTFQVVNGQTIIDEESIGGEFRFLNTLEFKYKLNDTLRFYTFADGGATWLEIDDFEVDDLKYSVGIGFGMQVPFLGPLRIDYGFPINPDDDQGGGRIHLQSLIDF